MRLAARELRDYLADVVQLAERYGIVLDLPDGAALALETGYESTAHVAVRGFLPDGRQSPRSVVELSERWAPSDDDYERIGYRYELIDHDRDYRRAFHWHDDRYFARAFGVVVHEHCESPIGRVGCAHFYGPPVRDGFRAVELLMAIWVGEAPDCGALPCLEEM